MNGKGILIVAIILMCVGFGNVIHYAVTAEEEPTRPSFPSPEATPAPSPAPAAAPSPTPTFEPIVITGSGDKTSPPFTIPTGEWIIDWSYIPDDPDWAIFGFFIFPRGETVMYVESVIFPQGTSGSTYSYAGSGEYYIKVQAISIKSWEIIIRPV